jgi:hypothetical protein
MRRGFATPAVRQGDQHPQLGRVSGEFQVESCEHC